MPNPPALRFAAAALAGAFVCAGCGKEGPPRPPLPRGPLPPRGVAARQIGATTAVAFEVPDARGDHPAQQPVRAELVRVAFAPGIQPPTDPDSFRRRGEVVSWLDLEAGAIGETRSLADPKLRALAGDGVGFTLRYAVRVRDRKGRPSPLVVAPDLVPMTPVGPPSDLLAEPTADGVRLSWSSPDAAGGEEPSYNVYRTGAQGGSAWRPLNPEPIAATAYLDSSVETGATYVYTVRVALAKESPYREGESGPGVAIVAEDRFAPAAPVGLVAVQEGLAVRLFWDPNQERDLIGYRVYRGVDGGPFIARTDAPLGQAQYLDDDVRVGPRFLYRVTAIDRETPPNESEPSEAVEVELRPEPATEEAIEP